MAGRRPFEMRLSRTANGWKWHSIELGLVVALALDGFNGGLHKINDDQVSDVLSREGLGTVRQDDWIYIFVSPSADSDWEKIAVL